uniref:Uncharacterized protein n=1 Tax=Strigamia maritima TaxID=126957 RepID=T1J9X5_STRMM
MGIGRWPWSRRDYPVTTPDSVESWAQERGATRRNSKPHRRSTRSKLQNVFMSSISGSLGRSRDGTPVKRHSIVANKTYPADDVSVVEINELQNTSSIDNLSILSHSQLPQGRIFFTNEFSYEDDGGRPYCRIASDTTMDDIGQIMGHDWKLSLPTIVMVVISSIKENSNWKNHKQWTNLQTGIIEAANTTNMWIVTHGADTGIPKMIGNIVHKEKERRQAMKCYRHPKQIGTMFPDLYLLGIIRSSLIQYDYLLENRTKIEVLNQGETEGGKYELNPDHSHFVIIDDPSNDNVIATDFVVNLEKYILQSNDVPDFGEPGAKTSTRIENTINDNLTIGASEIPVIALLIGGGYKSTLMVLEQLKSEIPVVVIKGSEGAANLLAFAYEEIKQKSRGDWDPDYVEHFIKSELSKKIASSFPKYRDNNLARNKFRDSILECIRHSHKEDRFFLTFLDIYSHKINLAELNQHILRALFKATTRTTEDYEKRVKHLHKDMYLTLDWNSPHIALSEIFQKKHFSYKVDKKIFQSALLRTNRESFISLFLDQGFQVHRYLNEKRFHQLFLKAESPEFFRTVCMEGMLGYSFSVKLGREFVANDFNWIIKHLTKLRNFVDIGALNMNHTSGLLSAVDQKVAERKAQTLLALWAVLMNRPKLAKLFWERTDYPIHLSLVIGLMYSKLVPYVRETHLIHEMEERSKEFANMAVCVLDMSFLQNNCRAFDILSEQVSDWNFKTAVEIAADARNRAFIAHPCCQKWLTNLFFGDIRIRELKWGTVTLPVWIKVVLSAFLIFPMYIWVHFKTGQKRSIMGIFDDGDSEEGSDVDSDAESVSQPALSRMCSREADGRQSIVHVKDKGPEIEGDKLDQMSKRRAKTKTWDWNMLRTPVTFLQYFQPRPQPPLWKKIYIMWNAPVTKFWTYQIFYIMYLTLFSLAVLQPGCGNVYLDSAVWIWTALILMENIRKAYIQYRDYSSVPLLASFIEIILLILFLLLYMTVRIIPNTNLEVLVHIPISSYSARVVLCIGLLYVYYRFIWIYLPISPTLGPLLFRIKLMVTVDFVHFLRLTLLFIISGGIVIHSVIYPNYPMDNELLRRVFHRAWFTLFITPFTDELEGHLDRCNKSETVFLSSKYDTCTALTENHFDYTCPRTGFVPYLMVIQYLIILKLILVTLLTALYSNTAQRDVRDTDAIWKFQRYHLVLDFNTRYRLPAPLNAISFMISIIERVCAVFRCQYCRKQRQVPHEEQQRILRLKQNDHNYWRGLAAEFSRQEKIKEEEKDLPSKQMECMQTLMQDIEHHSWMLRQMQVRFTELEKIMLNSKVSLEEIKHELGGEDAKVLETVIHQFSRQSPYPGTRVKRFPLADRYVPWEVQFSIYDPVVYSKKRSDFQPSERDCVDEDMLQQRNDRGGKYNAPNLKWNFAYTSGAGITTDRTTWITTSSGEPLIYKLDSSGLPMNPMGRTGLRGRGCLYRWGPNHCIYLVVTRWRTADEFLQSMAGEEQRELEFISMVNRAAPNLLTLPGAFIMNYDTVYESIQNQFLSGSKKKEKWNAESMQKYFASHARAPAGDFVDIVGEDAEQLNFISSMLMRGYMDDNQNTDNAWLEAEVWHFHYTASLTDEIKMPVRPHPVEKGYIKYKRQVKAKPCSHYSGGSTATRKSHLKYY